MCDLLALNFASVSFTMIKRELKKCIPFDPEEHKEIFLVVIQIHKDAKYTYSITGRISVILAKDETKIKGRVASEFKWDTFIRISRLKSKPIYVLDLS